MEQETTPTSPSGSQTPLIIGVVVALIALGAGAFFFLGSRDTETMEDTMMMRTEETQEKKEARTLRDLLTLGQSQKCTFTNTVEGSTSDGTVYFSGSRMRGDFVSKTDKNVEVRSHMITDGKEMRMWTDGEDMGFLMKNLDEKKSGADSRGDATNVDLDKAVDYRCEQWIADAAYFVPPANVMFHDMNEMMQHMPGMKNTAPSTAVGGDAGMGPGMEAGGTHDMKSMQCMACDSAPTPEAKAQCKTALGCE